ncbi:MAG: response regulator [Acidobacteria bacterium]|nr:response regulator [Acidobacteriota bacterium]
MAPAKILIVEDEQITATDIEDIVGRLGYDVVGVAPNGPLALDIARRRRPELALMDIRLKGEMDGVQTARRLREQYDTPSIFLTAHADDSTLDRAKDAEPLGYIVKPFHEAELQAALQMALHKCSVDRLRSTRAREMEDTLEALAEGVVRTDELGAVLYLNHAAERWTGWKLSEARGKRLTEVLHLLDPANAKPLDRFIEAALRERRMVEIPIATKVRARDGIEREVAGTFAPVTDGLGHTLGTAVAMCKVPEQLAIEITNGSRRSGSRAASDSEVVVHAPAMLEVMRLAERVATSQVTTVLLQGESGVGKDVLARRLHELSSRAGEPFIAVNCAAIPDTLLESEVFGYEKGAFTDARSQKKGVLDLADGGTVFLDEIGELQPHLQAKLLRVLEEQTFRRLGGVRDVAVDLRIITATNRDLAEAVRLKEFREDLYYRLNVITIAIPPLRKRSEDIVPLALMFIERYNQKFARQIQGLTAAAEAKLLDYSWPGNVREVRNAIERAMVLADGEWLDAEDLHLVGDELGERVPIAAAAAAVGESSLEDVERAMLVEALERFHGNQTQAAKALGITRDTLRYRIKKYDLK